MSPGRVAVAVSDRKAYPRVAPFHPPERYPEMTDSPLRESPVDPTNSAYAAVRDAFRRLGLDAERYGTPASRWRCTD